MKTKPLVMAACFYWVIALLFPVVAYAACSDGDFAQCQTQQDCEDQKGTWANNKCYGFGETIPSPQTPPPTTTTGGTGTTTTGGTTNTGTTNTTSPTGTPLTLNPSKLDFGLVLVGQESIRSVTLSNENTQTAIVTEPLSLSDLFSLVPNSTGCAISGGKITIPPSAQCQVTLKFAPTDTAYSYSVSTSPVIRSNASNSPVLDLMGGSLAPQDLVGGSLAPQNVSTPLILNPSKLDFGLVLVGQESIRSVTLSNENTQTAIVTEPLLLSDDLFSLVPNSTGCAISGGKITIPPSAQCQVTLKFAPTNAAYSYSVSTSPVIRSNASNSPVLDLMGGINTDTTQTNSNGQTTGQTQGFKFVASSGRVNCAIRSDNSLSCWGGAMNVYDIYKYVPEGSFIQVSINENSGVDTYACAIRIDQTAICWGGKNEYGQNNVPNEKFSQISVANAHACGIRVDGGISCWGGNHVNNYGKAISPSGAFSQVAVTTSRSCAIRSSDNSIVCWGKDAYGGDIVVPQGAFSHITLDTLNTCGVRTDGTLICTSSGDTILATGVSKFYGQCGIKQDNTVFCLGKSIVAPVGTFKQISSVGSVGGDGFSYGCGIMTNDELMCWGSNYVGELTLPAEKNAVIKTGVLPRDSKLIDLSWQLSCGLNSTTALPICYSNYSATPISGVPQVGFSEFSVGYDDYNYYGCGIRADNKYINCFGGGMRSENPPTGRFTEISVGGSDNSHIQNGVHCGIQEDGSLVCWGSGSGLGGDKVSVDRFYPPVEGKFSQVSIGHKIICAIRVDGYVNCWGNLYPLPSRQFSQISVGLAEYENYICGILTDGSLTCFGKVNPLGTTVKGTFSQVSAGGGHVCAIRTDGTVACWGLQGVAIPEGKFIHISSGISASCGVRPDNSVVCWGKYSGFGNPDAQQSAKEKLVASLNASLNKQPIAQFTATPEQGTVPLAITLDASTSTDPEGKALTYEWTSQPALSIPAEKAPKLTLSQAGTYTFSLTVKDDKGLASAPISKTVTVAEIPKVTLSVTPPVNGQITLIDAILCGGICKRDFPLNTSITLTAKPAANFMVDSWTGCVASADKQTCQVTMSAAKTVSATFKPSNSAPTAEFKLTPTSGTVPLQVEADASLSKDADGSIVKYEWETSAGDKITGTTAQTFFTFRAPGSYTVTLKVTDNQKVTTISAPQTVTVNSASVVKAGFAIKAPVTVCVGTPFEMTVRLEKQDTQPIDAAQIALHFDPSKLQIDSVVNSGKLDFELDNQIDNATGTLSFIAGASGSALTSSFDIITLKATAKTSSEITFLADSVATSNGNVVQIALNNQTLSVENCLDYKVNLQRKTPSPDASWQTALKVSVGNATTAMEFATTSDNTGKGKLILSNPLAASDYLCVKSATTLANRIDQPFGQPVDFGTLLEGDSNDDNKVTVADYSIVTAGKGTPGDKRADLNRDGQVDTLDMQLLQPNLKQVSKCTLNATLGMLRRGMRDGNRDKVGFAISSLPTTLQIGENFNVTLRINATETQPVAAGAGYINFDPSQLQVNSITPGTAFDINLESSFDNALGEINFAAGVWDNTLPTQPFDFMTVNFKLLQLGGERSFSLNNTEERQTVLATEGEDITARGEDGQPVIETATPSEPPTTESSETHGIVSDATGKPLVGATVQIGDKTTVTDDSGYWQITGLIAGEHVIIVKRGEESYTQTCSGEGECHINMATSSGETNPIVEGQYTLYGTVRDMLKKPQANVTVYANDRTTITDATGKWEMSGLPEGDYVVKGTAGNFLCLTNISVGNQQYRQEAACKQQSSLNVTAKSIPERPIYQGENLSYAIMVTNESTQTAQNVVLNLAFPQGAKLVGLTAEDGECDLATARCTWSSLSAGSGANIEAMFSEVSVGFFVNMAVNADSFPTDGITKRKTVKPYLSTSITCTPKEVFMLSKLHCSITAELSAFALESTATGVQLRFTPSKGTEVTSVSAANYGQCSVEDGAVVCTLNDLSVQNATQVSRAKIEVDLKLIDSGLLIMTSESKLTATNYPEHRVRIRTPIVIPKDFKVGLVFGIDTTNSMSPYLNGIIKGFEAVIQESATKAITLPWMVLLEIKDDVRIVVPPTQDINVILKALRSLRVGGGGTCPEASAEAFHIGADFVADNGVLAIATNAPPYPETDVDALKKRIGELYDKGVAFHLFYKPECDMKSNVEQGSLDEVDISTFPTTP